MTIGLNYLLDLVPHCKGDVVVSCTMANHLLPGLRPEPLPPNGRFHLIANLPRLRYQKGVFLRRVQNHYRFQSARYPLSSYFLVILRRPRELCHHHQLRQSYRGRQIVGRKISPLHGQPAAFHECQFQNQHWLERPQIPANFSMKFRLWPSD